MLHLCQPLTNELLPVHLLLPRVCCDGIWKLSSCHMYFGEGQWKHFSVFASAQHFFYSKNKENNWHTKLHLLMFFHRKKFQIQYRKLPAVLQIAAHLTHTVVSFHSFMRLLPVSRCKIGQERLSNSFHCLFLPQRKARTDYIKSFQLSCAFSELC